MRRKKQIAADREKKRELARLPKFFHEPPMKTSSAVGWDGIDFGSAIKLTRDVFIGHIKVYPILFSHNTSGEVFKAGSFGLYLGMTPVGWGQRLCGKEIITRNFRTILLGGRKYLLNDPNDITSV